MINANQQPTSPLTFEQAIERLLAVDPKEPEQPEKQAKTPKGKKQSR